MKSLNLRKSGGNLHFSTKKKEAKKKGTALMEKWKTQEARFPLSHRARYQRPKQTTRERTGTKKEGGLPTAIIDEKPETAPRSF